MGKKIIWLVISCLMTLSLVIASCGPSEPTTPTTPTTPTSPTTPTTPETSEPEYGGTLNLYANTDPSGYDDGITLYFMNTTCYLTNEDLLQGDWLKGPAGTEEISWKLGCIGRIEMLTGSLAESYEMPDDETIIFHIRPGIHWQNKEPVNGREYTAEDAAWNLQRHFETETAYLSRSWPVGQRPISYKATDKYTLEVKVPKSTQGVMALMAGSSARHFPKEMVEEYGDMSDWRNACGTGAFMLTEVIPGSTITYSKNPDYWMNDPLNPENKLPYVDTIKQFTIPDQSTMLSAFRTGKLDIVHELLWEDKDSLMDSVPSMQTSQKISSPYCVYARLDKDLPFKDIKVRQAMNLAINQQELVDDYYEGNAALFAYPYPDSPDHSSFFIKLEDLPTEPTVDGSECSPQELFGYDVEKAKQLLADAGYPDGFSTSVVCQTSDADLLSIIREYLLAVNIDMKINALEFSIYNSTQRGRNHEELLFTEVKTHSFPFRMLDVIPGQVDNVSFVDDPMLTSNYGEILKYVGKDDAKVAELIRNVTPYRLENSYAIWMPGPYKYNVWWPWINGYNGEYNIGYATRTQFSKYLWIDSAMKADMGY